MIKAIIFDLDDTLYSEFDYVKSGFKAISKEFNNQKLYKQLLKLFKEEHRNVYQRAGLTESQIQECIQIYRSHFPKIKLKKGTVKVLQNLRKKGYKIGIITDGRPEGQKNKISALRLNTLVDHIIVTDELGGVEYRKPNPTAFILMKEYFNLDFGEMIYIGDNPNKDFIAPKELGMKTCFFINPKSFYNLQTKIETDFSIKNLKKFLKIKYLKTFEVIM